MASNSVKFWTTYTVYCRTVCGSANTVGGDYIGQHGMGLIANRAYIARYIDQLFPMGAIELAWVLTDALQHSGAAIRACCLFRAERLHGLVEYLYICIVVSIFLDKFSKISYYGLVFFGAAIAAPLPFFLVG